MNSHQTINHNPSHNLPKSILKTSSMSLRQSISYSERKSLDIKMTRNRKRQSVQFHSSCRLATINDLDSDLEEPQLSDILYVKHCFKTYGIRANNRSWLSCLVVCERGHLKLFKARSKDTQYTVDVSNIGNQLGTLSLQHSLARPLPQAHHSTKRPYLIQLDLPNGAMYMIQLTNATHIGNWVGVLNYWAARETTPPNELPSFHADAKQPKLVTKMSAASLLHKFLGGSPAQTPVAGEWSPPLPPLNRSTLSTRGQLDHLTHYLHLIYTQLKEYQPSGAKYETSKDLESMQTYLNYLNFEFNRFEIYIKTLVDFIQFQLGIHPKESDNTTKWLATGGYPSGLNDIHDHQDCNTSLPLNFADSVTCLQTLIHVRPASVNSTNTSSSGGRSTSFGFLNVHQLSPGHAPLEVHRRSWSLGYRLSSPMMKFKYLNLIKPQTN